MSKKKTKPFPPCKHEKTKEETGYIRRTEKPIDGYKAISFVTCTHCNKQLEIIGDD